MFFREFVVRFDGVDRGREVVKLLVWRCFSEFFLVGARRLGRRWSWVVRGFYRDKVGEALFDSSFIELGLFVC